MLHLPAFLLQDYDEAIKRSSANGSPSPQALVQQGILLHRLRKGNVSTAELPVQYLVRDLVKMQLDSIMGTHAVCGRGTAALAASIDSLHATYQCHLGPASSPPAS